MSDTAVRTRRWPIIVLAIVGAAAVAFAVGRFTMFSNNAPVPNAADIGFARDMQIHHAQAIEMAMTIYRDTEDDELRVLSYDIATGQAGQRGEMYDWLVQWNQSQSGDLMAWMQDSSAHAHDAGPEASELELMTEMGMATDAEMAELRASTGTAADCQFLSMMIRHHEGALDMTAAVLDLGSIPRVLQVAQSMQDGQTAEIDAMQSIQSRLACTP